jgi:hypothetical protein
MRRPAPCHAGGGRPGLPSGWRARRGDTYLPLRNPGAFSMRGILDWALGGVLGWGCGFTAGWWRRFMGYWCHNMRVCLVAGLYGAVVSFLMAVKDAQELGGFRRGY